MDDTQRRLASKDGHPGARLVEGEEAREVDGLLAQQGVDDLVVLDLPDHLPGGQVDDDEGLGPVLSVLPD